MEPHSSSVAPSVIKPGRPKLRWYAVAFAVVTFIWIVVLELVVKPRALAMTGVPILTRLAFYLLPPLIAVSAFLALHWSRHTRAQRLAEEKEARAHAEAARKADAEEARLAALDQQRRFSLEILGVGLSLEYLRHEQALDELQSRDPFESILSSDPTDYPSTLDDKEMAWRQRESEALEPVLAWLNDEWEIPLFLAGPPLGTPQMQAVLESNISEVLAEYEGAPRQFRLVETLHREDPDELLQRIFDFMDRNTEVPAVLLVAEDGTALRNCLRGEDDPECLFDGPRSEEDRTETVVALLLGVRERLEPMKSFIVGDSVGDDPMKPYWEKERVSRSASAFVTTDWLPRAWSPELIAQFSELPVLGHLHRPAFVQFPGSGEGSKASAFSHAWEGLLVFLGEGGGISHLLYDVGPVTQGRRLAPFARAVRTLDQDFDAFDQGINQHRRMGETGAAAPFLGLALAGVAASRGEHAASVFLRREEGASLCLIRAPEAVDPAQPESELATAEA